jgi:hypothetical protein
MRQNRTLAYLAVAQRLLPLCPDRQGVVLFAELPAEHADVPMGVPAAIVPLGGRRILPAIETNLP